MIIILREEKNYTKIIVDLEKIYITNLFFSQNARKIML